MSKSNSWQRFLVLGILGTFLLAGCRDKENGTISGLEGGRVGNINYSALILGDVLEIQLPAALTGLEPGKCWVKGIEVDGNYLVGSFCKEK